MWPKLLFAVLIAGGCVSGLARADTISYTGGTYAQDFNTLPATGTFIVNTTDIGPFLLPVAPINAIDMPGWSFARSAGSPSRFLVGSGGVNTNAVYSFGALEDPERALGSLAGDTAIHRFGAEFTNDSSTTFTEFTLTFAGEQWRDGITGSNGNANTLSFSYAFDAPDINTGAFTPVLALNFVAPKHASSGNDTALNGNLAVNQQALSATITGLAWSPGTRLVLRWSDVNDSGSDDGLAIDNLTFSARGPAPAPDAGQLPGSAVPLPSAALAALPLLTLLATRRSRRHPRA